MKDTITVTNQAQRVLLECELKGQISDGHWENSRPHRHWERPCAAEVVVGDVPSINFGSLKYNFTDKKLIDLIAPRLIGFVKFYTLFPRVAFNNFWYCSISEGVSQTSNEYWDDKRAELRRDTGFEDLDALAAAVNSVEYSEADLIKDLQGIKAAFRNQII